MTARADRAYSSDDVRALFADEALVTVVPWSRAAPLGRRPEAERHSAASMVSSPPRADRSVDLDPRKLSASQPSLVRAAVAFYLEVEYRRSGRTYADQMKPGNKYPIVHARAGALVVLLGHHRAAAARLQGTPLRARVVTTAHSSDENSAVVLTPSQFVGGEPPGVEHERCNGTQAAEVWITSDVPAWLPDTSDHRVRHLAYELSIDDPWIRHQLHFARTGRIRLPIERAFQPPRHGT
jgi:hypothetical protein